MDPVFNHDLQAGGRWLFLTASGPFYLVFSCFRYSRMSDLTVLMGALWNQRMTGTPLGPTRNFSKFQRTSWTFTGSQDMCLKEPSTSEG